jgi:alpha-1,6-mannosyltransferase
LNESFFDRRERGIATSAKGGRSAAPESSLKIVDITEFYSERGGGIRSHLTNRAAFLAENRHDHLVIAPGPRDEDEPLTYPGSHTRPCGSRLVRFAGPSLPYDPTYHLLHRVDKVRRRVRAEQPDVIEAHSLYLATAGILASGRRAARLHTAFWHSDHVGVHVESVLTKHLGCSLARSAVMPLWKAMRALLSPFDAIFAAGRQQTALLRAAGVPRVIHTPLGVDTRTFNPAARRETWRHPWVGEASDVPILIACARLAQEKRFDVLLHAFAQVRSRRRAVLVIYGDGPERTRLERAAPPGVHFAGFETNRAKLAAALASADLLVHAAPYETFGLGIAEGVACGLPIVVPDAGAAAEHAESACSEVYKSLDVSACAAAIEAMLDRLPDRRQRALAAVGNVVTIDQHFAHVLGAYRDLIEELGR